MLTDLLDAGYSLILLITGILTAIVGIPVFMIGFKNKVNLTVCIGLFLIFVAVFCFLILILR